MGSLPAAIRSLFVKHAFFSDGFRHVWHVPHLGVPEPSPRARLEGGTWLPSSDAVRLIFPAVSGEGSLTAAAGPGPSLLPSFVAA
mmetsp:Transcript_6223/g.16508  ORF Transcript_6223/g.16508 Transcript_6223/m.16508 type:complete len:85 (+) Transcript_6223:291-545(+)|eukprot:1139789-Pelagomonas_calceolata.AAC.2